MAGFAERRKQVVELSLQALILYSVVTMALETMPELAAYRSFFATSEVIVVVIFTLEYVVRWSRSVDKLRYPFSFFAVVDLLAILPFYISLGVDL